MKEAWSEEARVLALTWRLAALADGWTEEPTYKGEPVEHAARMRRDGFLAIVVARPGDARTKPYGSLAAWGPDGLGLRVPVPYDWEQLRAGLRHCTACGADDVDTTRYSFAGRCCAACLPEMRRQHEKPGWTS